MGFFDLCSPLVLVDSKVVGGLAPIFKWGYLILSGLALAKLDPGISTSKFTLPSTSRLVVGVPTNLNHWQYFPFLINNQPPFNLWLDVSAK